MDSYRKYIVCFIWGLLGILILSFILLGGFFYLRQKEKEPIALIEATFCGVPNLSEEVQQGKELFYQNCLACHKLDGFVVGPSLRYTDSLVLEKWLFTKPIKEDQIEYGRMFHFNTFKDSMTEDEIEALYQYLNAVN